MLTDADTGLVTSAARENLAAAQSGSSGEGPDILANLLGFSRFTPIQSGSGRLVRFGRLAARERRRVWRDGLLREPPHARNRCTCGFRRPIA